MRRFGHSIRWNPMPSRDSHAVAGQAPRASQDNRFGWRKGSSAVFTNYCHLTSPIYFHFFHFIPFSTPSPILSLPAMAPALALHPRGACQECAGQYPCAAWVGTPGMGPSTYGARQVKSIVVAVSLHGSLIFLTPRFQQDPRRTVQLVITSGYFTTVRWCHHRLHEFFHS